MSHANAATHRPIGDERTYDEAHSAAVQRVKDLRRFYRDLIWFALVVPGLWAINLRATPKVLWAQWPMLGWGLALMAQALMLFSRSGWFGPDWERRKVAELMARENLRIVSGEKQQVQAQLRLLQAQIEPPGTAAKLREASELI